MEIRFDPAFVEEAVFLELKARQALGDAGTAQAFRAQWDAVYETALTQQDRDAGFERIAQRYFLDFGFAERIESRFLEFPLLQQQVPLAVARRVWSRKEERVELYVTSIASETMSGDLPAKSVLLALMPQRCVERDQTVAFLRSELMHISDMLDPAFAYEPHPAFGGECETENDLIRERFRLLWNVWVAGRMRRNDWLLPEAEQNRRGLDQAFALWEPGRRKVVLQDIGNRAHCTQRELLELAKDERLTRMLGAGGVRCPLCHFPTRDGVRAWDGEWALVAQAIHADYPDWTPAHGACLQCAELYRTRVCAIR